jgi:uncharacterized protein with HEPN domain
MPPRKWTFRIEDIIWETVQHNLPPLVPLLRRILEEEDSEAV